GAEQEQKLVLAQVGQRGVCHRRRMLSPTCKVLAIGRRSDFRRGLMPSYEQPSIQLQDIVIIVISKALSCYLVERRVVRKDRGIARCSGGDGNEERKLTDGGDK